MPTLIEILTAKPPTPEEEAALARLHARLEDENDAPLESPQEYKGEPQEGRLPQHS